MAEIVLDTAVEIGRDPQAGLVDKIIAWQAAHRVRADLQDRTQLPRVQSPLVHALEDLGDPATAYQVTKEALDEDQLNQPGSNQHTPEHDDFAAALLRLAQTQQSRPNDPLIDATVAAVAEGGAAIGLEARIWTAIDLLGQPGQRKQALKLTDQISAELNHRNDLGAVGNRWRLLLAFHAGRAGYPAITQQLLAPMLDTSGPPEGDAARAVLYAIGGPRADTRLQIVGLEAELAALPPDTDDDRLRVHHALAANYGNLLGNYRSALHHSQQELPLRHRIQGVDHSDTLTTRYHIAFFTGQSGHLMEALRLLQQLLLDMERVLGPDHPNTLSTRNDIALFTGQSGHPEKALRLFQQLLPDQKRVLRMDHPNTLLTRSNIAVYTGHSGHPEKALRLFQQLLPDQKRVLGPDHPNTLLTRSNIANLTGQTGHPEKALRLFQQLLPDRKRVLGPDHPDTLSTRNDIAFFTGQSGHPEKALRLLQQLLPEMEKVLGPDHPDTQFTRYYIAFFTGLSGRPEKALQLFQQLLPDQERVLGPDHPSTLTTQRAIQRLKA